jgi:hypothetical protein
MFLAQKKETTLFLTASAIFIISYHWMCCTIDLQLKNTLSMNALSTLLGLPPMSLHQISQYAATRLTRYARSHRLWWHHPYMANHPPFCFWPILTSWPPHSKKSWSMVGPGLLQLDPICCVALVQQQYSCCPPTPLIAILTERKCPCQHAASYSEVEEVDSGGKLHEVIVNHPCPLFHPLRLCQCFSSSFWPPQCSALIRTGVQADI